MAPSGHPAWSTVQVERCSSDPLSSGPTHEGHLSGVGSQGGRPMPTQVAAEVLSFTPRSVGEHSGPDGWSEGPAGGHAPCLRRN